MITNATFEKFALSNLRAPTSSSYTAIRRRRSAPPGRSRILLRPPPPAAFSMKRYLPPISRTSKNPCFYEFVKSGREFLHLELPVSTTAKVGTNERRWCGKHFFFHRAYTANCPIESSATKIFQGETNGFARLYDTLAIPRGRVGVRMGVREEVFLREVILNLSLMCKRSRNSREKSFPGKMPSRFPHFCTEK